MQDEAGCDGGKKFAVVWMRLIRLGCFRKEQNFGLTLIDESRGRHFRDRYVTLIWIIKLNEMEFSRDVSHYVACYIRRESSLRYLVTKIANSSYGFSKHHIPFIP